MRRLSIKRGDKYNRLTAVRFDHQNKHGSQFWLFRCSCGNEKVIEVNSVKRNLTKSCGCLKREQNKRGMARKHGMRYTREYGIWTDMKSRCLNKNRSKYKSYGARGIEICKRWMKFENFYKDMGKAPEGKSLDRIDNNGNYEPSNCRWATRIQQANNTRRNHFLTYNGKTMTIAQWTDEVGITYMVLWSRINKYGWSIEKALSVIKNKLK